MWVTADDSDNHETQQWLVDSVLERQYHASLNNIITVRFPYGLTKHSKMFLVSHLLEHHPNDVFYFNPYQCKYVKVKAPTDDCSIFKIRVRK